MVRNRYVALCTAWICSSVWLLPAQAETTENLRSAQKVAQHLILKVESQPDQSTQALHILSQHYLQTYMGAPNVEMLDSERQALVLAIDDAIRSGDWSEVVSEATSSVPESFEIEAPKQAGIAAVGALGLTSKGAPPQWIALACAAVTVVGGAIVCAKAASNYFAPSATTLGQARNFVTNAMGISPAIVSGINGTDGLAQVIDALSIAALYFAEGSDDGHVTRPRFDPKALVPSPKEFQEKFAKEIREIREAPDPEIGGSGGRGPDKDPGGPKWVPPFAIVVAVISAALLIAAHKSRNRPVSSSATTP